MNFIHDKYGIWIRFADFVDDTFNFDWSDFSSTYYPNGMPDSVAQLNKFEGMETDTPAKQSEYEYDDRLRPEENAEIEEYCNNPTDQIAKDICKFIS